VAVAHWAAYKRGGESSRVPGGCTNGPGGDRDQFIDGHPVIPETQNYVKRISWGLRAEGNYRLLYSTRQGWRRAGAVKIYGGCPAPSTSGKRPLASLKCRHPRKCPRAGNQHARETCRRGFQIFRRRRRSRSRLPRPSGRRNHKRPSPRGAKARYGDAIARGLHAAPGVPVRGPNGGRSRSARARGKGDDVHDVAIVRSRADGGSSFLKPDYEKLRSPTRSVLGDTPRVFVKLPASRNPPGTNWDVSTTTKLARAFLNPPRRRRSSSTPETTDRKKSVHARGVGRGPSRSCASSWARFAVTDESTTHSL